MRASGRSTLFTTSTTGSRASSALRSTNRVCGSGPSDASTSSMTPSTIVRPRSTSPPKSAWPGVSTRFSFTSPYRTAAFFARIVMPRSRSWSIESMTRSVSASASCAEKTPDWRSIASTSVVFPWSTCAMIATLRMSVRRGMGPNARHVGTIAYEHEARRRSLSRSGRSSGLRGRADYLALLLLDLLERVLLDLEVLLQEARDLGLTDLLALGEKRLVDRDLVVLGLRGA